MKLILARTLLDLAFPRSCAGCHDRAGDEFRYLCWNCLTKVKFIERPYCLLCGNPVSGAVTTTYFCSNCMRQKPFFDCARSAALYNGLIKEMILDFKYRGAVWLGPDLGELLFACLRTHFRAPNIDGVAYVPLHKTRERQRTYNQSFLLAKEIAGRLGKNVNDYLARVQATESQTHLTSAGRADNVRNKFAINGRCEPEGQRVLLVDDVMTTGATVNECALMLKKAGAREVLVLTVARG
ncbi:MAG: ComF family protein [Kiritimatiellia bacterium]|nr:ComF family protein [Kiritimatiellia bacterium]